MSNKNSNDAKRDEKDEFYTQLSDIGNELRHYKNHFKGKTVYCNCDDPRISGFFDYFSQQFEFLGLKRLITTCYKNDNMELFSPHNKNRGLMLDYKGKRDKNGGVPKIKDIETHKLKKNGCFKSDECIELLKQADIVVTNPPFSMFRKYVSQLMKYNKKFIIIGNQNAATYKEIFPLVKDNKMWLGHGFKGGVGYFINKHYKDYATASNHKEGMIRVSGVHWFTNLGHKKRHETLHLVKEYDSNEYPKYNNYDAIEVGEVADIPRDYAGCMGVPVTFLNKFNPDQFEIIGMAEDNGRGFSGGIWDGENPRCIINGNAKFKRIFIKNKHPKGKK